ncbi:MAG: acetate kinase [Desulfobacteraceae bacterium]|nr:acetate kinase [Desulfobacteraceae bacterium]
MKILVINAGSSSLKYQLFNMEDTRVMAGGVLERIGEKKGVLTHTISIREREEKIVQKQEIKNHKLAMHLAISMIVDPKHGVINDISQIDAVGHRVVQGGEAFGSATFIDDTVKKAIRSNNPLAPLHNPPNLIGIEVSEELLPGIPNIAIFDTEFHQTMPPKAFLYALPYEFYTKFKVRKYGFHGTSHKYISHQAAQLLKKDIETVNLITIHLGNGCSISAVEKGKCIDTSMGMTPLAGVMMGTRAGDIDPAIIGYLLEQTGMDIKELDRVLNKKSGLKGICGMNDMRDIHDASQKGDPNAALAVDMFCYQIKKYIGAYAAALGKVDAIVFSAGVGENDGLVRAKICNKLSNLGIRIDTKKNLSKQPKPFSLHSPASNVEVWVVPTNEEFQIAKEVKKIMTCSNQNRK